MTGSEVIIDTRELEPPEPLERVLEALCNLKPGEHIRMIHRFEPRPLYPMLEREGFTHETLYTDSGDVEVVIRYHKP
jgi:uncharacterized protein (DUF2249 family)